MQTSPIAASPILKPVKASLRAASSSASEFGETLAHSMESKEVVATASSVSAVRGKKTVSSAMHGKPDKKLDADSSRSSQTATAPAPGSNSGETLQIVLPAKSANDDAGSKNDAAEKASTGSISFDIVAGSLVIKSSVDLSGVEESASCITNPRITELLTAAASSTAVADGVPAKQAIFEPSIPRNASARQEANSAEIPATFETVKDVDAIAGTDSLTTVTQAATETKDPLQAIPTVLPVVAPVPAAAVAAPAATEIKQQSPDPASTKTQDLTQPTSDKVADVTRPPETSAAQSIANVSSEPMSTSTPESEAAPLLPFALSAIEVSAPPTVVTDSKQDNFEPSLQSSEASQPNVTQNRASHDHILQTATPAEPRIVPNVPETVPVADKPAPPQKITLQETTAAPLKVATTSVPQPSGSDQVPATAVTQRMKSSVDDQLRERQPEAVRASVENVTAPGLHRITHAQTTHASSTQRMDSPSQASVVPADAKQTVSEKAPRMSTSADTREASIASADSQRETVSASPYSLRETTTAPTPAKETVVAPTPASSPAAVVSAPPTPATHELPEFHKMLDSAPTTPAAPSSAHITTQPAGDAEIRVGIRTAAFGALEIYTSVHQNQVGIAVHGGRDLTHWFSTEVQNLESGLRDHHLNLTTVELDHTTSGFQAGTGSHRHSSPEYTSPSQFTGVPQTETLAESESVSPSTSLEYSVQDNHVSIRV